MGIKILPKLVVLSEYFAPGYKYGGPISSIVNFQNELKYELKIYIISSNKEFSSKVILNVKADVWLKYGFEKSFIFYKTKTLFYFIKILFLIKKINPLKIFVNGIYSIPFSIIPALLFPKKTIMHVRGMLHPGALGQKAWKKKLFLGIFKIVGLHKRINFCVSDAKEEEYTKAVFGNNIKVHIAQNFPAYFPALEPLGKGIGQLYLCSIGLISPMKNHALILEALALVKTEIVWDIYGPIKDSIYWKNCQKNLANLPANIKVNYKQEINPSLVYDTLKKYHVFILPSQSENFGHALYEAMIAAKPIITSLNTPWNNLEENKAGINVDLTPVSIAAAIETFAAMPQEEYNTYVSGVRTYAEIAIDRKAIKQQYLKMFGVHDL